MNASAAMGWDLDGCQGEIRRILVSWCCSPDPLLVPSRSLCLSTKAGIVHQEQPRPERASPASACVPTMVRALVHQPALGRGGVQTDVVLAGLRLAPG